MSADLLTVGLGNPGPDFAHTRHNAGADAIALLAEREGLSLRRERGTSARCADLRLGGRHLVLAIPETFMNDSGRAVAPLCRRYGITDLTHLVLLHDELDLPPGSVRIKSGGGIAGHNGLRSAESHLHSRDFLRVRIGIGRPPGRMSGADYVLRRPGRADAVLLEEALARSADAVVAILGDGPDQAMNTVNVR